jgi:hypothetical protein
MGMKMKDEKNQVRLPLLKKFSTRILHVKEPWPAKFVITMDGSVK